MTGVELPSAFDFEGQTIRYGVQGSGAPIVLVHGTPFSSHVWHRIAPLLAQRHRVYCFDLLGYGQSEKRDGQDVSLGIQNRAFAALLRYWRLEQPHVVAHDVGGATSLRAHLLNGCEYRSLTLIDPVALAPWGSSFVQHVRQHEAAFAGAPSYIHRAVLEAYIAGAVSRQLRAEEMAPYLAPWLGDVAQRAFYRQVAQMDQRYTNEVEPLYHTVHCPVQILWGEEDAWIPIERGRQLAALIPGAHLQSIGGAGHLVQEDQPEAIIAAVLPLVSDG
jgi:pimeloyl-ACP methyl ester carboxylesterase